MAAATVASRVTGFARVLALVAALGLGSRLLDAYTAANVTPNTVTVLFAHGNAVPAAAQLTGSVLAAYGLALVPFAGYQIMMRVFYALGDTRTPALLSVGVSAVTVAACLAAARLVSGPDLVVALAACSAVAYTAGLVVTALVLRHRLGRVDGHRLLDAHTRIIAAAAVAGLAAAAAVSRVVGLAVGTSWAGSLVVVGAATVIGAGLYALIARVLRVSEIGFLAAALRMRSA